MKIALVGIGKIAVDQHVPAIAGSPDWELAATVSRHGQWGVSRRSPTWLRCLRRGQTSVLYLYVCRRCPGSNMLCWR